ncbi:MAG: hypothetical protein JNL70_24670 [Saprospiraceae bacterium]|nr:hypothetical protein [Saprospiraceae bacterium]
MRLIIFTNRDLASNLFLNHVLPHVAPYVVHIFLSDKVGKKATTEPPKDLKDLKFFEQTLPNDFIFDLLDTQKRQPNKDSKLMTFNELSDFYSIPFVSLNNVALEENLDKVKKLLPDLVLSVRYGKIFKSAFLSIPKLGVINLHSGRLPQYRGVLPTFRALMNGDEILYPTLHYIDNGTIDTGGIIGSAEVKVETGKSLLGHVLSLYPASVPLVVRTIQQIANGEKPLAASQTDENAAYFTFPTEEEILLFKEKTGIPFVDTAEYEAFMKLYTND